MYIVHFGDDEQEDLGPMSFEDCEEELISRGYCFQSSGLDPGIGVASSTAYTWTKRTKGSRVESIAFIKEVIG